MASSTPALQSETVEVLQRLIRCNTVNPPGNEREAIAYLTAYLAAAGFETQVLACDPARPNLIATLRGAGTGTDAGAGTGMRAGTGTGTGTGTGARTGASAGAGSGTGAGEGPTLAYLGHVDTVLADTGEWEHDPFSGDLADGYVWGRGAIDMKSQVAAEAVAAASLARNGWRPRRGALKLIFVADEETGGRVGSRWLTREHPDAVRCDMLLNEGAGGHFELGDRRYYGVSCGEKGIYRFKLTASGVAGHAAWPTLGLNALLQLAPAITALAPGSSGYDVAPVVRALLAAIGLGEEGAAGDPTAAGPDAATPDPAGALSRLQELNPDLRTLIAPMLGVTFAPTVVAASTQINVTPAHATVKLDCRVPPGFATDTALTRLRELLGATAAGLEIESAEGTPGYVSPHHSPLMDAIAGWLDRADPGARAVPWLMPAYTDSNYFRAAFPDVVAYGFFPQRHQSAIDVTRLMHNAKERVDVRDLGFAAGFYADLISTLLG
jgi:acetylornithine deacetylase/succinyl-diaminopimelate desuccinylase-like protein